MLQHHEKYSDTSDNFKIKNENGTIIQTQTA